MAVPLNPFDHSEAGRTKFSFACTASGVAAKCARNWGYKPWKTDVHERVWDATAAAFVDDTISLAPFYDACLIAARADYCQDGQSFTRNGTLVDLFDTLDGFTSVNATVGLPYAPNAPGFMMHEEYQVSVGSHVWDVLSGTQRANLSSADQQLTQRLLRSGMESSRYPDLDPGRSCAAAPYIDRCDPKEPYSCYRATNLSAVPYGPFLAVNSARHCSHDEQTPGEALDPLCNECVNRVCKIDPTCCADPGTSLYAGSLVWDDRCAAIGDEVCRSVPGAAPADRWDYGTPAPPATGGAKSFLTGAIGSFERIISTGGAGAPVVVEGWSCDPDFPGSPNPVQISVGGPLGTTGATLYTTTANRELETAWKKTAEEACGGPGRHGFHFELPGSAAGQDIYVYGIDLNVPGAPFSLLRGGKKSATRPDPRAAIWTGWFEPTVSHDHTFHVGVGPTDQVRVWVNGTFVFGNWTDDSFTLASPASPPVQYLQKGVRYGVRVEYRRVGTPLPGDSAFSIKWSTDGGATRNDVSQSQLYPAGQGSGNGLEGSFFAGDFRNAPLPGTTSLTQTFGAVDKTWTVAAPGSSAPTNEPTPGVTVAASFAARFQGQVVPPISGDYTFTADTDGSVQIFVNGQPVTSVDAALQPPGFDRSSTCSHDICQTGAAVSRTCQQGYFCASQICLVDPSCCAITWDGHCVEEVASVCNLNCSPTPPVPVTLRAGVKYDIRVEYRHSVDAGANVRGAHLRLMWALPGSPRDVIPKERLFAATSDPLQAYGVGINAAYFTDDTFTTEALDCVEPALAFAPAAGPCTALATTMIDGAAGPTTGAPPAPTLGLDHVDDLVATVRGGGAAPNATVRIFEGSTQLGADIAITANGSDGGTFTQAIPFTTRGSHTVTAIQIVGGVPSATAAPVTIVIPGLPPAPAIVGSTDVVSGNGSVTVSGTGTIGATVKVTVNGTAYSTTVGDANLDGIGDWTLAVTVTDLGITSLSFLQEIGGRTSELGATVNVKRPLPALVVTSPTDGATLPTGALTIAGFAPALGQVIVEEGDGRFWVERARFSIDPSTGAFPADAVAPLQLDYGRHLLRFHQHTNGLDGDGVQRTLDVQPPHQTLVIESVASLGVATNVPATPAPVIAGDLTVKGRGGLRRACPDTEPACTDATGMAVRLRVYAGLTATDANPTKIGEGTLADNGSFDVSVRFPAVGTRWISVSQVATSLSGGGSVESDRSAAIAVRGRPSQPTVVSPTSNDPPFGYVVPVVVSAQTDVDHVVVTADPGIPSRVVTLQVAPTSPGHFEGTLNFTNSGTYVLTAAAEADGAIGNSSTPPVVIVVGDVTPPSLTDSAGQPLHDLPTVTVTSGEGATIAFADGIYSADGGSPRARCLDPGAAFPCTCTPASGSFFPLGTTTITCSATDASGNVSSAPFNVTVKNSAGPTVSGSSIVTEAEGPEGAVVNYQVAASGFVANCAPDGSDGFEPCESWNTAHEGLGFSPQAVAVDPFDGTLYAGFFGRYSEIDLVGAAGHLFRSSPGGEAWTEIAGPQAGPIRQIVVGRGTPASLYVPSDPSWTSAPAASTQGLWISHDAGGHWSLALPGLSIERIAIDPAYPTVDHVLAWTNVAGGGFPGGTSAAALYETFDGGATWASVADGLPAVQILSVALDPLHAGRMYASVVPSASDTVKAQIYLRVGNEPWSKLFVPVDPAQGSLYNSTPAATLSVAPMTAPCPTTGPCPTYPTLFGGRWMSFDGGDHFVQNSTNFDFAAMAFDQIGDPLHPGRVAYAVSGINTLFRSFDYGRTWAARGAVTAPVYASGSFVQDRVNANRYYAASSLGLFRSTLSPDDFSNPSALVNWTALPAPQLVLPGVVIKDLATDPVNPSIAYLVSDFGAFRTQNGGGAWTALNDGLTDPLTLQTLGQVLVDRFDRRTIYAGGRIGLSDPAWKMLTGATAPLWTRLQHTACSTVGDACFLTVPPTATLRSVSGRLTLDPLVSGNWISLVETADVNNTQALLDSDLGPIHGTYLSQPSDLSVWTTLNANASHSPFAYRIQLVPDAARTMVISYATNTLGQPGLGQPPGGHDILRYNAITSGSTPYQGGKWSGIGAANLIVDSSDGVDRVFVGGAAIGRTASLLYRARVADVRDNPPAAVAWEQLGGNAAFATTSFSTLAIDPGSGGQHMYTLGAGDASGTTWKNQLWESRDGGRTWQPDAHSPKYLSRIWVSPADGGLYATVNPTVYDTNGLFLTSSSPFNSTFQPSGILWKRTAETGTPAGKRIVVGDLPVSCVYPASVPLDDLRRLRAIGPGATFPVGVTTLECTATDAFQYNGIFSLDITVTDTTPPVLTVPAQVTGTVGSPVDYVATARDLVKGKIDPTCVPPSHTTFSTGGIQTVKCTASDGTQSASASFPIVVSATAPILNIPADITAEADSAAGKSVPFAVTGTKADGSALPSPPQCATSVGPVASGDTFALGTTMVDCTADDGTLRLTRSFRVTVQDTTPPAFNAASVSDITLPLGSSVAFAPLVTDAVTAHPSVTCAPDSHSTFPLGKTVVTCRATDGAGNQSLARFTVTMTDVNPPALHLKDMVVSATDLTGAWVTYQPADGFATLATDVEDAAAGLVPDVTCVPSALPPEKTWFPIDPLPTTVTCTARDHAGNETTGTFGVLVVDTGKPIVTMKETAPLTAEATGPDGAGVTFTIAAADIVDGTVAAACEAENGFGAVSAVSSGATFPLGESKITCRATDRAGNTGELKFSIMVNDTKAPALKLPAPLPLTFGVDGSGTATVTFKVTATDDVTCPDGDPVRQCAVACTPRTGSQLLPGRTTVTCTARDAAGNESRASFPIDVSGVGGPCTASSQCGTGFCVDGVCCATACGGGATNDCQACSIAMGGTADGTCTAVAATHTCRPSAGACDVAETCDGVSVACPADAFAEGTTCRGSTGGCDPAETCTGTSAACPADVKAAAGTICRASAGACDPAEICDGSAGACPADAKAAPGTICRASAGLCDRAETCDGLTAACPVDAMVAAGTQCRASAGACDPAETCTGTSAACPADAKAPIGTACRASAGTCDVPETCDGASAACPADIRVVAGTTCRPSVSICDLAETCDGTSSACPPDGFAPPATQCRASAGVCDIAETCTGTSATCPADRKAAAGTQCRASAGPCDVAETCDGATAACPTDRLASQGTVCGTAGTCQQRVCSGSSVTCPSPTPIPGCGTDTKPPVITVPSSLVIAYAATTAGANITYNMPTAVDDVDGPVAVTCSRARGALFPVGKTTVTCTATDSSHNTSPPASFVVWVQYQAPGDGTFFLSPIRPDGSSVFKIGRAVPVKFQLLGASAGITNLVARLVVTQLSGNVAGSVDCVSDEDGDDTDMLFKYRKAKGIYGYRWKTSNQTKGTYELRADLGDGVIHKINVSLKVSK